MEEAEDLFRTKEFKALPWRKLIVTGKPKLPRVTITKELYMYSFIGRCFPNIPVIKSAKMITTIIQNDNAPRMVFSL